jgi:quercetin 2,3-dioxygenase
MNTRNVEELIQAQKASDGDGVQLMRVFGGQSLDRFDPFLMMDEFGSDRPSDYIGGFPSHPHRGFETVTYMLEGHMEHRDHMGNVGDLQSGDVQWMTAGAGIIHSEMPKQNDGRLRGFQVWLNLPAREKMQPPSYRDISAEQIPVFNDGEVAIKAIAGTLSIGNTQLPGYVRDRSTEPGYLDVHLPAGIMREFAIPDGHTALLYVYEGEVQVISGDGSPVPVARSRLARLSQEGSLRISTAIPAKVLLLTGRPLKEPIVHYGPFVMNSREEIEQALADYHSGRFVGA